MLAVLWARSGDSGPKKHAPEILQIKMVPPPPLPPPPPPPKVDRPPDQKLIEQPKMQEPAVKPDKIVEKPTPAKPNDPPPGPLALDAKGAGPGDAFGLGGKPGGSGILGGGGGGGGTKFGWYASLLQTQLVELFQRDEKVNTAQAKFVVELWLRPDGTAEKVEFIRRTGDGEVDQAILSDLLHGLRLSQTPPADMPQPVVIKLDIKPARA